MEHTVKSIRPFTGAKDFQRSRAFYRDLGFTETVITNDFSVFTAAGISFYLQHYYVKEWIENTMVLLEVDSVDRYWNDLKALNLTDKYDTIKLTPPRTGPWGKACFVHDPAGVLLHFTEFFNRS